MKYSLSKIVRSAFLVTIAATTSVSSVQASTVIYRQNFGNSGSTKIELNHTSVNWRGNRAAKDGAVITIGGGGSDPLASYSNSGVWFTPGAPGNLPNVNSTTSQSDSNGYLYVAGGASAPTYHALLYQNVSIINRSEWAVESFSWYSAATFADNSQRLVIRFGAAADAIWYASDLLAPAPSGMNALADFANVAQLQSVDFDSASWYRFDLATYAINSTSEELPLGDITAFGVYSILSESRSDSTSRYFAIDNFTVSATAIPEPQSIVLAGFAIGAFLLRRYYKD